MGEETECQVKGCTWPVVLCPELCAPHWWKLDKSLRDVIVRARIRGLKDGNDPNLTYSLLIAEAIGLLDADQGNLAKYEFEPGDHSTRHSRATNCAQCNKVTIHHGVVRAFVAYMVCFECKSMVPVVAPGSQPFEGMEAAP